MASKLAQQLKVIGMTPKAPGLPYVVKSEITPKDKLALQKALLSCLKGTTFPDLRFYFLEFIIWGHPYSTWAVEGGGG